jgi:hypothetical protein
MVPSPPPTIPITLLPFSVTYFRSVNAFLRLLIKSTKYTKMSLDYVLEVKDMLNYTFSTSINAVLLLGKEFGCRYLLLRRY